MNLGIEVMYPTISPAINPDRARRRCVREIEPTSALL